VVRALEHAAAIAPVVQAGEAVASQRMDASSRLRIVGAILSGTHEPGTSHYDMLRAFVDDATLRRISRALDEHGYRTHEFGDSVFLEDGKHTSLRRGS
jgi:S-adenosylmethionine:tRNA ribosyltransferase-isomerase